MHLFSLPRELRDIIYFYVLPDHVTLVEEGWDRDIGLLLANRQLRIETLETFYLRLPRATIVVPPTACDLFPSSLQYAPFRERAQRVVIQRQVQKLDTPEFVLHTMGRDGATLHCSKVFEHMPALREITYDIAWKSAASPSILLPSLKRRMLNEIRRVTVGEDKLAGWEIECQVKDATRWKIGWSGVVKLRKLPSSG
jgi:hypothetical protein